MERLTDEQLALRWQQQQGSPESEAYVNELFERHHRRVALWCLRFAGDRETAADWAQEVFLSAYRNLGSFRGESKFSTWLYVIARNQCINEIRARHLRPETIVAWSLEELPGTSGDPHQSLEEEDVAGHLRRMLEQTLDETELRVLTLHYAQELPLDVITRLLGLTNPSGAKAYVVNARRKLQHAARRWKARFRTGGLKYAIAAKS